jgi:hypothetical protein
MAGRVERRLRPAATPGYWRRHVLAVKVFPSCSIRSSRSRVSDGVDAHDNLPHQPDVAHRVAAERSPN